jgi:hypothetical protein
VTKRHTLPEFADDTQTTAQGTDLYFAFAAIKMHKSLCMVGKFLSGEHGASFPAVSQA